jgi:hypothetical protein
MALADFTPERVEIKHNGSVVCSVRGLGTDDISVLVRAHLDTMNKLFEIARSADDFGSVNFFAQMVTSAPQIAMDVIALAADEPNYPPEVRQLPMGLQIKILQEVTRMTFEDIGGPKAVVGLVQSMLRQRVPALTPTIQ